MTDFIFMVKDSSYMFVTGPDVVRTVTHENVTHEQLGGALTHTQRSGVADLAFENDVEALLQLRRFIDFLPVSNRASPPRRPTADSADRMELSLDTLVPSNANKPYDMKELIQKVVDEGDFFELAPEFAGNILTGFGRLEGTTVGIVANQPMVLAGCLDIDSSRKLFQHSHCHVRRRARIPARHRPGIQRHHQARCEAALRLRRSNRAQGDGHHPQGLWRGL